MGPTALTAQGPVTQRRYRFAARDAVVAIDGRDAAAIGAIPNLIRVR